MSRCFACGTGAPMYDCLLCARRRARNTSLYCARCAVARHDGERDVYSLILAVGAECVCTRGPRQRQEYNYLVDPVTGVRALDVQVCRTFWIYACVRRADDPFAYAIQAQASGATQIFTSARYGPVWIRVAGRPHVQAAWVARFEELQARTHGAPPTTHPAPVARPLGDPERL